MTTSTQEHFAGARIGLLEARLESELAALVHRMGGVPLSVPAVSEVPIDAGPAVAALLDDLAARRVETVIFLTGVGCQWLFATAEALGRDAELHAALAAATLVCRGPKPAAALRAQGLRPTVNTPAPYTTTELLAATDPLPVAGRSVAVVSYGDRNETLAAALRARGATPELLQLYEWRLPADLAPLRAFIDEVLAGRVAAVTFTSQVQARHLFALAEQLGRAPALRGAFGATTAVASIGPSCTGALLALGVEPQVTADPPKMRPMMTALAGHLATRRACAARAMEVRSTATPAGVLES